MTMHVVIPFIDLATLTIQAANDAVQQGDDVEVLLIDNGSTKEEHKLVRDWQWEHPVKPVGGAVVFKKSGTLDEVWNAGLKVAWDSSAEDALVMNNDARIHPNTYKLLRGVMQNTGALFVSAVNIGVVPEDFPGLAEVLCWTSGGGPDYSCFLISKECHERFPFDPAFTYRGDLDHHRRIMLAGEGDRIFSVPLGYHHLASQTIKRSETAAKRHAEVDQFHLATYISKWGGPPNEENYWEPYTPNIEPTRYTRTPDLQHLGLFKK